MSTINYTFMMGVEGWMLGGGEMLHCYHADEAAHHAVHTGRRLTDISTSTTSHRRHNTATCSTSNQRASPLQNHFQTAESIPGTLEMGV